MPNIARVYDYLLGGKDNFTADRAAGDMVIAVYPGIVQAVKANRAFLSRAIRYLAGEAGIRQFLDIGPGIPTASNTHEVAQAVAPASRVVYVDNDPVVLVHARALLRSKPEGAAAFVDADLRDIGKIVAEAGQLLDFSEPVAVVMLAVLHFVPDDAVYDTVNALMATVAPGSFVAISHIAKDIEAESITEIIRNSRESPRQAEMYPRTRDEVTRMFTGLELAEPGVVALQDWRPDSELEARNRAAGWAGVARKPLSCEAVDSSADAPGELLCRTLGTHRTGRVHGTDADLRREPSVGSVARLRRALQRAPAAPVPEPAPTRP